MSIESGLNIHFTRSHTRHSYEVESNMYLMFAKRIPSVGIVIYYDMLLFWNMSVPTECNYIACASVEEMT